tara:strand:+ start:1130 stop:3031 length:1902 start_codon:yes stop_codon:yes gene_type:complete
MAVDPSVRVDLAVEYKGKKAFDQADRATQKLTNNVKKLAGAFGVAFSTRAVVNFAKESVKAFAADDAAIIVLRKNLQNLGLAYESTNAETFISNLEKQAGILDDELRPAYSQLAKVTLSAVKTQELMTLAVDLSRSTGLDFSTVIKTLSRAYIGNYKGLKQLNIGLTDAELKTKDFAEIQAILIKQSKGAGKAYIETFAGSIDKLAVASANAKEIIGEGLVDLFVDLAGNGDINKATDNINTFAKAVSDLLKDVDKLTLLDYLGVFLTGSITKETFNKLNVKPGGGFTDSQNAARLAAEAKARKAAAAAAAKAAAAAAAAAAKKAAADKKALANEKARAALTKAASVFDLNKIQIAAALKATYDKDERLRLLAMQEIENDNGEAALKHLAELKLLTQEQQTNKLAGITAISQTELDSINKILLDELARISSTKMTQEQADEARAEAYRKYNAAIIASGGLAEANFYTEKTQTDLLKIAKLAALHDVATAQATLDILNYTTQTEIIARIAAAQKIADDAKTKALKDYLALLGTAAGVIAGLPGGPSVGKGTAEVIPRVLPPGVGGGGQPIPPGYGGIFDYMPPAGSTGSSNSSVTVIVEGSVLDGNDFVEIVNDALLDANRRGLSRFPAGTLPG